MYNNTMKKKKAPLNKVNQARRNAEAKEIVMLLIQRSQSGANGEHQNPADRRCRTRNSQLKRALKDFE